MSLPREVIALPLPGLVAKRDCQASAAVRGGAFVFVSGLTAVDPATGEAIRDTTARETQTILENLKLILEAAGSSLERVVKVNVLVHSMLEAPNMNEIYRALLPRAAARAHRMRSAPARRREGHDRVHRPGSLKLGQAARSQNRPQSPTE